MKDGQRAEMSDSQKEQWSKYSFESKIALMQTAFNLIHVMTDLKMSPAKIEATLINCGLPPVRVSQPVKQESSLSEELQQAISETAANLTAYMLELQMSPQKIQETLEACGLLPEEENALYLSRGSNESSALNIEIDSAYDSESARTSPTPLSPDLMSPHQSNASPTLFSDVSDIDSESDDELLELSRQSNAYSS